MTEKLQKNAPEVCRECRKRILVLERQIKSAVIIKTSGEDMIIARKKRHHPITGAHLHKIRERFELTQKETAFLLGTTLTSVNRWENGRMVPSLRTQRKIAELRAMGKRRAHNRLKERDNTSIPTQ